MKRVNEIDIEVGIRLKARRIMLGLSRSNLSKKIGVTHQQIQKYESGTNRISAGNLWYIAKALNVPVDFFYKEELPQGSGKVLSLFKAYHLCNDKSKYAIEQQAKILADV